MKESGDYKQQCVFFPLFAYLLFMNFMLAFNNHYHYITELLCTVPEV